MMKLSTMCTVDSTVDTQGGSPIAEQILTSWDHDQESLRFFRSSANFVETVVTHRSMDLPPHGGDPAWLQSLRLKFENWLDDYKASLENHS